MDFSIPRFYLIALLSLILHAGAFAWYFVSEKEPEAPAAKASNKLMITAGIQSAMAGANLAASTSKAEPLLEKAQPIIKPVIPPKNLVPSASAEARVKKAPVKKPAQKKPVVKKMPKAKPVKPAKKTAKTPTKEIAKKAPSPNKVNSTGMQGINGSKRLPNKQKETGKQNDEGGTSSCEKNYEFLVNQHLIAKKVIPSSLRTRNKKGKVLVAFTLDRSGKVIEQSIARSSNIYALDKAAKKLMRDAEPFPKALSCITKSTSKFKINLNYNLG